MNKLILRCSASVLACLAMGTAAHAQAPAENTAPDEGEATEATSGIQDIVVTAQRRSENLQKSSLSISAVSGRDLVAAGVTQPTDLTRLVPGVQISQTSGTAQPYIRGVGNASNTGAITSGVAFNLDGVYISQPQTFGVSLYDLARVEIVKGPQGTLYGRNATGGAINLITNQPTMDFGGEMTLEAGNYDLKRATGAINVPLAADLAARVAFNVIDRDGYFKDGTGDDVQQSIRARIKWTPGNHSLMLTGEYNHVGGVGAGTVILDGGPLAQDFNPVNVWDGTLSPSNAIYLQNQDPRQKPFIEGETATITADLNFDLGGGLTLTLLPAYREYNQDLRSYNTFGINTLSKGYKYEQSSAEGRLSLNNDRWKAVLGLYYFHQDQNTPFRVDGRVIPVFVPLPPGFGRNILLNVDPSYLTDESVAVFGQATYSVSDSFRVIGGLRYSKDKTRGRGVQTFFDRPGPGDLPGIACSVASPCVNAYQGLVKDDAISWKVGAEYDVSPSSMLYATASTGFKAGGTTPNRAPRNVFKPEKLTAFEIGSKNRFLDNRVQLNLEAFLWKYRDKQETFQGYDGDGTATGGILTNLTTNAGKATIYGAGADLTVRATDNDTIRVAGEYNHTNYDEFLLTTPPPAPMKGCIYTPTPNPALLQGDCSGNPLTRAPKWTGIVSYEHVFPLSTGAEVRFGASGNFASSRYLSPAFVPAARAPSYFVGNLELTYAAPDDRWSVTAYGRNLADKEVLLNGDGSISPFPPNVYMGSIQPPRTYGVRLNARF